MKKHIRRKKAKIKLYENIKIKLALLLVYVKLFLANLHSKKINTRQQS